MILKLFCIFSLVFCASASPFPYKTFNNDVELNKSVRSGDDVELPDWGKENEKELKDLVAERKENPAKLIDNVAYRGKPLQEYQLTLRDMNSLMRDNYAKFIEHVGFNLYPVIIASDSEPGFGGVGTSFTLFLEDGTSKRIVPAPKEYEMYKDLGHMALGIFSIISPYFHTPNSHGWHKKLSKYQTVVKNSLSAARNSASNSSNPDIASLCGKNYLSLNDQIDMLSLADEYLSSCFIYESVDYETYQNFTAKFTPYVMRALTCASEIQVFAAIPEMTKWKKELGDKWRDLYVLIPVIWPVARRNPRQQVFETLMDEDRIKTHILKIENAKTFDEMRTTMGRIVGDRTLAQLVFGLNPLNRTELNLALSTRRDLVSSNADLAIEKYYNSTPSATLLPNH